MMTESNPDLSWSRRLFGACAYMPAGDRRNLAWATWALVAWCAAYVAASLLLDRGLVPRGALAYLLVLVTVLLAIASVLTWAHFLRHADELQRKIQMEAMALGFGGGFVASFGLELLESVGVPRADVTTPFSVMALCYLMGLWLSGRRYA